MLWRIIATDHQSSRDYCTSSCLYLRCLCGSALFQPLRARLTRPRIEITGYHQLNMVSPLSAGQTASCIEWQTIRKTYSASGHQCSGYAAWGISSLVTWATSRVTKQEIRDIAYEITAYEITASELNVRCRIMNFNILTTGCLQFLPIISCSLFVVSFQAKRPPLLCLSFSPLPFPLSLSFWNQPSRLL
jgi:hypothetical protein